MKVIMEGKKKKKRWKKMLMLGIATLIFVRYFRTDRKKEERQESGRERQDESAPAYSFRFLSGR